LYRNRRFRVRGEMVREVFGRPRFFWWTSVYDDDDCLIAAVLTTQMMYCCLVPVVAVVFFMRRIMFSLHGSLQRPARFPMRGTHPMQRRRSQKLLRLTRND
ncbi:unnamed protein product, partial [Ectocarpus sp. 13 AM-2016]